MKMNYYLVTAKCGHVGRHYYIPITFPVKAENGREAAKITRQIPRVKHNRKDAIIECRKVDMEEYVMQQIINACDPYLQATSKQEQNKMVPDVDIRVFEEVEKESKTSKRSSHPNLLFQKRKYLRDNFENKSILIMLKAF